HREQPRLRALAPSGTRLAHRPDALPRDGAARPLRRGGGALPRRGVSLADPERVLLRALPRASRAGPGARGVLPRPARGKGRLRARGALPPGGLAPPPGGVRGSGDSGVAEEDRSEVNAGNSSSL